MDSATKRKFCKACQQIKPVSDYYKAGTSWQTRCKPCHTKYVNDIRKARPKKPTTPKKRLNPFEKLSADVRADILLYLGTMTQSQLAKKHNIRPSTFRSWKRLGYIHE